MRFCLLVLAALAVVESVSLTKQLEKAVTAGQRVHARVATKVFAYEGAGAMHMTVSKVGHQLSEREWASLRKQRWHTLDDAESPLAQLGFDAWEPTPEGIRFRNPEGDAVLCAASEGASSESALSLSVGFHCAHDSIPSALVEASSQIKEPEMEKSDYDDNQKGELWVPAENGVPYGWNRLFKSFGFPYFTVTPKGYLGCYKLDHGMCSMTPTSFSTTGLQPPINTPAGPPERWDMTPKFPQGTNYVDHNDLRTKPEDVKQAEH